MACGPSINAMSPHATAYAGPKRKESEVAARFLVATWREGGLAGCGVTGVNISREQVRQARELIAARSLSDRVVVHRGDARALDFADESFDAVVCLEAAGDICVTEADKARLVSELFRVLRPGGHVGFSDLALREDVSPAEDRDVRAVLYHSAAELVTDWPAIFAGQGFRVVEYRDIITDTLPTWDHVRAI